jgi:hypothetical protein
MPFLNPLLRQEGAGGGRSSTLPLKAKCSSDHQDAYRTKTLPPPQSSPYNREDARNLFLTDNLRDDLIPDDPTQNPEEPEKEAIFTSISLRKGSIHKGDKSA